MKKYVRYLQHGNRNAGRLQTRPRRRERARAHPPHAGTRGSDDPTEIRPEVQGEAPRQAPRVPSRILQEETHPVNVQLCWHVGQIKSSMGGASSPTHAQWYTPLHFSQYMPSSSSTPHTRHASGLESSKYSAIGSGPKLAVFTVCCCGTSTRASPVILAISACAACLFSFVRRFIDHLCNLACPSVSPCLLSSSRIFMRPSRSLNDDRECL